MGMHNALMGTIDKCGYGVQQKGTIYDARGPYPLIWRTLKPIFAKFDWFVTLTSHLNAYISRYGNFCANDYNNDNNQDDNTTNYFNCPCARDKNSFENRLVGLVICPKK